MPSAVETSSASNSRGRFELPVLAPLESLTAGTDIPPPPDSPIEEKVPAPKPVSENVSAVAEGAPVDGKTASTASVNGTQEYTGRGRTDGLPTSPTSPSRPTSIRRFLSRKSLHQNYTNGTNTNTSQENLSLGIVRPESPSGFSTISKAASKRSGSWFRRFINGGTSDESDKKRTSIVYEEKESVTRGPPAPKLPELDQLGAKVMAEDVGSLGGDDMFKNIK
jgi:hypothetical protein